MIRAVIIDDERQSRNLLQKMLVDFCQGVSVVGKSPGVKLGVELLKKEKPDVVFLDIEMLDGNGFDVLNAYDDPGLNVVFVTGYDHYAVKAIKYAALDYLLKPVDLEELQQAVLKLQTSRIDDRGKLRLLQTNFENKKEKLQKIVLPGRENYTIVEVQAIIRIEANGSYVTIYLEEGKTHLVIKSLSHYEELLSNDHFFRIHKSHLINLAKIDRYTAGRRGKVILKDGAELEIAARRKSAFVQFFKSFK